MAGVKRRTQAERREATRTALLDSTVDCLAEHGYTRLTGAQIAARAGVSRGAQAHYFATKAELVVAALEHATERITERFRADPPYRETEAETVIALLDQLWALHDSTTFVAVTELWLAGRTDPDLQAPVARLTERLSGAAREVVTGLLPDFVSRPDGPAVLTTALAAVRGLLLTGFVADPEAVELAWKATRGQLEKLVATAINTS